MPQSVGHEERMYPVGHRLVHVAPDETERLESFEDDFHAGQVHLLVKQTRFGHLERMGIRGEYDFINIALHGGEPAVYRIATGKVAAIVHQVLGPRIHQQHAA